MGTATRIVLAGTAKSGLGHLRRLTSIARCLKAGPGQTNLVLMTNASPAGLDPAELGLFSDIWITDRRSMADCLQERGCDLAVLDTLRLPGLEVFSGSAALILRETPGDKIADFRRPGGRPWDRVILPNPATDWRPRLPPGFAASVEHAGWILRRTEPRGDAAPGGIVLATGGGGNAATRAALYPLLDQVLATARARTTRRFILRQALGPRAGDAVLSQADESFDPGPALNQVFRCADLVISTAGYNSVLELASTDTPALLVAIPRSLDDQAARVRRWGPKLGFGLDPERPDWAAAWLADRIDHPGRRPVVDLGPDGAATAARLLQEIACPAS